MSGICGLVHFDGAPVVREDLAGMAEAAAYRGPDGVRYRVESQAGVANLALHVTPESVREEQPLMSSEGRLLLTADARIDNRDELIKILGDKGLLLTDSPTDAELILAAYQHWGLDCPSHLLGDFAFAIWDASRQELFAARDPMGIRGFYYRLEPRRALFATEAQQILAVPGVPVRLFEPAVALHLCGPFGRSDWSFYKGIQQLAPGHALLVNTRGHQLWRFWDIDPDYRIEHKREQDYWEHFRDLFQQAVRCRLRSDKPTGLWLSGGTDSGSIASMAGWLFERGERLCPDFRAYCWAFEELSDCDERAISDEILRHYHLQATAVPADERWPMQEFPARAPDKDEPPPIVYRAMFDETLQRARNEQRRLLMLAERGDEVNDAPYDHWNLLWSGQWGILREELEARRRLTGGSLKGSVRALLLRPLRAQLWPDDRWARPRRWVRRLRGLPSDSLSLPPWIRAEFAARVGLKDMIHEQFVRPQLRGFARALHYGTLFSPISVRRLMWFERCHAQFGIGFADPWSDRRIASFILAIPQWVLNRVAESKRLTRQAMRGITPESVRMATQKTNPRAHYDRGFRERARTTVLDLIQNSRAAELGYLDSESLRSCYASYCQGRPSPYDFWWPVSMEMWLTSHW